jgi:hypothetical protein
VIVYFGDFMLNDLMVNDCRHVLWGKFLSVVIKYCSIKFIIRNKNLYFEAFAVAIDKI